METKIRIVTIEIIKGSPQNLKNRIPLKKSKAEYNSCSSTVTHILFTAIIHAISLAAHQQPRCSLTENRVKKNVVRQDVAVHGFNSSTPEAGSSW